ncbi:MAG TPA: hypothetical protein VGQ71_08160 [Terriglobales bacterium]|nr:hypothetical protein [Terriglobales bacterium]
MSKFAKSLLAVILGDVLYFSVLPYLPPVVRHQRFQIDLGLLVDASFCLIAYAILDLLWPSRPRIKTGR